MFERDSTLEATFGHDSQRLVWTRVHEQLAESIRNGVRLCHLMAVIGERGSGKSIFVREATKDVDERVYIPMIDRKRMRPAQVLEPLIRKLGEDPERSTMSKVFQARKLVLHHGVQKGKDILVVIKEAHLLKADMLRSLKDIMESIDNEGEFPLFSILLEGQEPLATNLAQVEEVDLRTRKFHLDEEHGWFTRKQRKKYLEEIYGDVIAEDVRNLLATLYTAPLELDSKIEAQLREMKDAGIGRLTMQHHPLPLADLRKASGLSVRDLAKLSGHPRSSVQDVLSQQVHRPDVEADLMDAISEELGDDVELPANGELQEAS